MRLKYSAPVKTRVANDVPRGLLLRSLYNLEEFRRRRKDDKRSPLAWVKLIAHLSIKQNTVHAWLHAASFYIDRHVTSTLTVMIHVTNESFSHPNNGLKMTNFLTSKHINKKCANPVRLVRGSWWKWIQTDSFSRPSGVRRSGPWLFLTKTPFHHDPLNIKMKLTNENHILICLVYMEAEIDIGSRILRFLTAGFPCAQTVERMNLFVVRLKAMIERLQI